MPRFWLTTGHYYKVLTKYFIHVFSDDKLHSICCMFVHRRTSIRFRPWTPAWKTWSRASPPAPVLSSPPVSPRATLLWQVQSDSRCTNPQHWQAKHSCTRPRWSDQQREHKLLRKSSSAEGANNNHNIHNNSYSHSSELEGLRDESQGEKKKSCMLSKAC